MITPRNGKGFDPYVPGNMFERDVFLRANVDAERRRTQGDGTHYFRRDHPDGQWHCVDEGCDETRPFPRSTNTKEMKNDG